MQTSRDRDGLAWSALVEIVRTYVRGASGGATDQAERVEGPSLASLALVHGVGALVAEASRTSGRPVPAALVAEVAIGGARHLRALEDLDRVRTTFAVAGIPWLLAKGPFLASLWFGQPSLRAYDDLDIYVRPTQFSRAVDRTLAAGGRVLDSQEFLRSVVPGEVRLQVGTASAVDLHWQPFFYQAHARRFPVGVEAMLSRARPWRVDGGADVLVPSVADGLVHLCLHASISGGGRLSWLVDIERYLASHEVDLVDFAHTVRAWHAEVAVAFMLVRTDVLVGSVRARELVGVLPLSVRVVVARAERLWGQRATDGALRSVITRSGGGTIRDTATWAARAALRRVVPALAPRRAVAPEPGDYFASVRGRGGGHSSTSS